MTPTFSQSARKARPIRAHGVQYAVAALAVAGLALVAGCSDNDTTANASAADSSSGTASSGGAGSLKPITVDAPGTTAQAAAWLGSKAGDFASAGLDVTVHQHTAADSPLVGLMAGQYPIVWTSAADFLVAREKGLPVVILGDSDLGEPGTTQVIVKEDSPVHELSDFAGKSIGIPGPTSSCAVTIPAALTDAGVDPSSVKLTPVALTDQGTALQRGVVDAVCSPDPFLSIIESKVPSRTMIDTFAAPYSGTLVGVYATTRDWAAKNPDLVAKFRAGLEATGKRLNGDQDALRKAIPTFTQVDPALAAKMALPKYAEEVTDPTPVTALLKLMKAAGLVKSDALANNTFAPES